MKVDGRRSPHPGADTIKKIERIREPGAETTGSLTVLFSPDATAIGRSIAAPGPGAELGVGRDVEGLCIEDAHLSRRHASVTWNATARHHQFTDANSANGTFVEGRAVEYELLDDGAVIRIGDTLLLYRAQPLKPIEEKMVRAARSDLFVVIQGETGAGKEVLAQQIHEASGVQGPLVAVNCATFSRELIAAELFGHTRGAFSGAERARRGLFVEANEGTLFLDEVADLPLDLQPALLRAVEEGVVRPVGADRPVPARPRILAATQVDLRKAAVEGRFRTDLLARLAQITLSVPPLRETRERVMPLMVEFAKAEGCTLRVTPDAAEALHLWSFPENIRELRSLARSCAVLTGPEAVVDLEFLADANPSIVERGSFRRGDGVPSSRGGASIRRIR